MFTRNFPILLSIIVMAMISQATCQQTCRPATTVSNILIGSNTLQFLDQFEQQFSFGFFPFFFSGPIKVAYALNGYDFGQINSSLNFYVNAEVGTNSIIFRFNAPGVNWKQVGINYIVSSRADILIVSVFIGNMGPSSTQSGAIALQVTQFNFLKSQAVQLNFLTSIFCSFLSQNLNFSISEGEINGLNRFVVVSTGPTTIITNITMVSVIYVGDSNDQFASFGGQQKLSQASLQSGNLYFNIFSSFQPIGIKMFGISGFTVSSEQLSSVTLSLSLVQETVLELTSSSYRELSISSLTLGVIPSQICNCESTSNEIYYYRDGSCVLQCQQNQYAYTIGQGSFCLKCPDALGVRLNGLGTGCGCLVGYEVVDEFACKVIEEKTCGVNQVANGSTCVCIPSTFNISGTCSNCPENTIFRDGACVSCAVGQIIVNGECSCGNRSIRIQTRCVQCPIGSFANQQVNTCDACSQNCSSCSDQLTCLICQEGTTLTNGTCRANSIPIPPDPPIPPIPTPTTAPIYKASTSPIYTTPGIYTDFELNSTLLESIPVLSPPEIESMFTLSFSNSLMTPQKVIKTQSIAEKTLLRIFMLYGGNLPTSQFEVEYKINNNFMNISEEIVVSYDVSKQKLVYRI